MMALLEQRLAEMEQKLATLTQPKLSADSKESPATGKPAKAKKSGIPQ